jgi:hypothetical protein
MQQDTEEQYLQTILTSMGLLLECTTSAILALASVEKVCIDLPAAIHDSLLFSAILHHR